MSKKFLLLLCITTPLLGSANSFDWGKTGHRTTGQIAEKFLSPKAKREIDKILNGHTLAFVSTYADEIKSDEKYKKYSPWHYVNYPFDKKYGEEKPSDQGDLVMAIQKSVAILKDEETSAEKKEFFLKMLVHFVGDLHQPLHVGRSKDKGGNMIQVRWFDKGSNLHSVWDSEMLEYYGMSYTELSKNTDMLTTDQINEIEKGSLIDWVQENQNLAKKVYNSTTSGEKLGYAYVYNNFPLVREQLQKGGIRLAKILNDIYN